MFHKVVPPLPELFIVHVYFRKNTDGNNLKFVDSFPVKS